MPASSGSFRSPTSLDVAKRAGVARSTVSHILNAQGDRFTDTTIARVQLAARELGYVPSSAGRTLARGRSDFVILLVPNTTFGHNLQSIIDLVSEYLSTLGLTVVVRFDGTVSASTAALVETLRPTALVSLSPLSRPQTRLIERRGCVVVGTSAADGASLNAEIGVAQAEFLFSRGHTRLVYAFMEDQRDDVFGAERAAGAARAALRLGLEPPERINVPLDAETAAAALATIHRGTPFAVLCYNDEVALAVEAGARVLNVAIPQDIAVIGVDATEVGQLASPRLSSVKVYPEVFVELTRLGLVAAGLAPPAEGESIITVQHMEILQGESA